MFWYGGYSVFSFYDFFSFLGGCGVMECTRDLIGVCIFVLTWFMSFRLCGEFRCLFNESERIYICGSFCLYDGACVGSGGCGWYL